MGEAERVELGREPEFALGRLTVVPSQRELIRDDGAREILEHRVMQVLVALARADGGIVTRDALTQSCWDGRVVGEDAINRVISRLRKTAQGIGAESFTIETVTKIGYRLVAPGGGSPKAPRQPRRTTRRAFVLGASATAAAAATGAGILFYRRTMRPSVPPDVDGLMAQAWQAWAQGTREGNSQAVGLYRHVVHLAPNYADGWGLLGCAYADASHAWPRAESDVLRDRARAAARRALELDPRNAYGQAAIAYARPMMGNWLAMERGFRRAIDDQPDKLLVTYGLALSLFRVGRNAEAAALFERLRGTALTPSQYYFHISTLWGAFRFDEAERLLDEAAAIYPTHPIIWFSQFRLSLHGGRPGAAIALAEDVERRPSGVPEADVAAAIAAARAVRDREPGQIEAVMARQLERARQGPNQAEESIETACALGRLDDAFTLAEAFYFSRGFLVPDPSAGPRPIANLEERGTGFLFLPPTRPMRADPRFARLVTELGLERYWHDAGVQPDYRRS